MKNHDEYEPIEEGTFIEFLKEQFRRTPWWLISVFFHIILFGIASLLQGSDHLQKIEIQIQTSIAREEIKTPPPEVKREIFEDAKPIKEDEPVVENPVIKEAKESDHNETANNEEFKQSKGNEDALSDKPFEGKSFSDAIGTGGGVGGMFGGRFGGKEELVARGGGGKKTEDAVKKGLSWLHRHQSPQGYWDSDGYTKQCGKVPEYRGTCEGVGQEHVDIGLTGLALLAFLGAGNTHKDGEYKNNVKNALQYLKEVQSESGCIGPESVHYMYNHLIATLAITEAYTMSGKSPLLKEPAEKAIAYIIKAQNPDAGWRYKARSGDNDTSVTGWAVMALKSAREAQFDVPKSAFEGALKWVDSVTDESNYYATGYDRKGGGLCARIKGAADFGSVPSMTAAGMLCRIYIGSDKNNPALRSGAQLLSNYLPVWGNDNTGKKVVDFYYWYYGTLVMFQMEEQFWNIWNEKIKSALVENQKHGGCEDGSWDLEDPWGSIGGRIYSTAINILTLEIYYRYPKVFK